MGLFACLNYLFLFCLFSQSKEEVMAVRLREADNIAAMAELQQQISELEIQVYCDLIMSLLHPLCVYSSLLSRLRHSPSSRWKMRSRGAFITDAPRFNIKSTQRCAIEQYLYLRSDIYHVDVYLFIFLQLKRFSWRQSHI